MKQWSTVLACALVVGACGPTFKLKEKKLTCSEPFHAWAGGLVAHVNQGNGNGEFDYDPLDERIDRIAGAYDLKTGDFFWDEEFDEDAYIEKNEIDGYGTIWNDGDLDIEYDVTAELRNDTEYDYRVRQQRLGCEMETWVEQEIDDQPDPTEVWEGEFTDGGYEYVHRFGHYGLLMEAEGRTENDYSYEERLSYDDDGVEIEWYEEGDGEGTVRREFEENVSGLLEGYWERELDGDVVAKYDFEPVGGQREEWSYEIDHEGTGSGELSIGGITCDLDFDEYDCELDDCSQSGLDGDSCSPPVTIPVVDIR